jgi:predicted DNA binding protein
MSPGIRATVAFDSSDVCPLAAVSASEETTVRTVATSVATRDSPGSVTEFRIVADDPLDDDRFSRVISYGETDVYRFEHGREGGCPCAALGRFGCPVDRYVADRGRLTLTFHAADFHHLQELVAALREQFPGLDIRRLVRDPGESTADGVFVDRSRLTDRQFEVLHTAYEMGYFEQPRRANAGEVAAALEINPSTFAEHLTAAQRKLLGDVLA